jgi:hypothetical protein
MLLLVGYYRVIVMVNDSNYEIEGSSRKPSSCLHFRKLDHIHAFSSFQRIVNPLNEIRQLTCGFVAFVLRV